MFKPCNLLVTVYVCWLMNVVGGGLPQGCSSLFMVECSWYIHTLDGVRPPQHNSGYVSQLCYLPSYLAH